MSLKGVFETDELGDEAAKSISKEEKAISGSSPVLSHISEQEKMDICDDLDDISEGEILSDKDLEEEKETIKIEDTVLKKEAKAQAKEPIVESVVSGLTENRDIKKDIAISSSPKLVIETDHKIEIQVESCTKEASEALLELASCFSDFGKPAAVESSAEAKRESSSETVSIPEECADKGLNNNNLIIEEFDCEATLSADEVREFKNLCCDEELINKRDPYDNNIASQYVSKHSYCLPISSVKTEDPGHLSGAKQNLKAVDILKDHDYSKVRALSPEYVIPPSPPKVMPVRKTEWNRHLQTSRSSSITETPPIIQPELTFPKRTVNEEQNILEEFLKKGVDSEDTMYLQRNYDARLQDDILGFWCNSTHLIDHPPSIPPPKEKKNDNTRIHQTGCARTEGYYKLDVKEKAIYKHDARSSLDNEGELLDPANEANATAQSNREARSNQRSHTTFREADCYNYLRKFNQLKLRKKQLKVARSGIHEWGLFALEPIAAHEMVIEYVGQMVRPLVADMRKKLYESPGVSSSYLFKVDVDGIIDATRCGNLARFINHSCNPNCYAKIIIVEGLKKVVIYSKQQINVNDEITYNYKFPINEEKIACLCGAPQCRGTIY